MRVALVLAAALAVWLDARPVSAQVSQSSGHAVSSSPTSRPRSRRNWTLSDTVSIGVGVFAFSAWTFYGIATARDGNPQPVTTFLGTFSGLSLAFSGVIR